MRYDQPSMSTLPTPSPTLFRAKGTVYRNLIGFITSLGNDVYKETLSKLPSALSTFASQQFLGGSWYDYLPAASICHVGATAAGMKGQQFAEQYGIFSVDHDVSGVYRFLVSVASVDALVKAIIPLGNRYFDFAPTELLRHAHKSVEFCRIGVPAPCAFFFLPSAETYIRKLMTIAGAQSIDWKQSVVRGRPVGGIETIDITWRVSWS